MLQHPEVSNIPVESMPSMDRPFCFPCGCGQLLILHPINTYIKRHIEEPGPETFGVNYIVIECPRCYTPYNIAHIKKYFAILFEEEPNDDKQNT